MVRKKVWIITGSISRIVIATIRYLLLQEAIVIVITDKQQEIVLPAAPGSSNLKVITVDLNDEDKIVEIVNQLTGTYGKIDAIISHECIREAADKQGEDEGYKLTVILAALPHMIRANEGHIFFVSFRDCNDAFTSSENKKKIALIQEFMSEFGTYLALKGVRVTIIDPGIFLKNYMPSEDDWYSVN